MRALTISAIATLLAAQSAQAVSLFDSSVAFNAALPVGSATTTETFGSSATGNVLTFSGITSTFAPNGNTFGKHAISGGVLDLFIEGDAPILMTWDLPSDVVGLGFDVFGVNSANFDGVFITIDDGSGAQNYNLYETAGGSSSGNIDGFVGFIFAGPVASVSFSGPGGFGFSGDDFDIDNLQIVTQSGTSVVPLPASLPLALAGLGAFAAIRGRRKS
ncbi:VPLPA-CTERM sorting domain-containing protein [Meridianimarinicoccus aquatilis]|nr:VPLPA-CTERM sorting domain-containing protein [Fluviibacterium aquatile]